jgi:hypothetical protein
MRPGVRSTAEEEAIPMSVSKKVFPLVLSACLSAFAPCAAHAQQGTPARPPDASDATVFASLCFQCHNAAMWSDHRQDRRGWEGVLYRMVGRGALWTEDEIRRMGNYLTAGFGPGSGPASGPSAGKPAK